MGRATPEGNETKYAHAEIRMQVVVICGPTPYQLYHRGALCSQYKVARCGNTYWYYFYLTGWD